MCKVFSFPFSISLYSLMLFLHKQIQLAEQFKAIIDIIAVIAIFALFFLSANYLMVFNCALFFYFLPLLSKIATTVRTNRPIAGNLSSVAEAHFLKARMYY